jgi:predicted acetyltransferase
MWRRYFEKALELGGDAELVAVHTSPDGNDDGFVHYSVKWKQERGAPPRGVGEVYDLWGTSVPVELALWQYLCSVDLVTEWYAEERPDDDAVQLALDDWRAYQPRTRWDEQWLRLLDVDAALGARSYDDVDGSVTIGVTDDLLPDNEGVWEVSSTGAKRSSVDAGAADLTGDVRDLAATYLGGTRWSDLAATGRVRARSHDALRIADRLFAPARAPFCGSGF